ncbi:MAG: hypothetical protein K0Q49_1138 [Haloplasmataceae bacterium]|jgi:membrane protein implicated in regulation of membrane protease activity|nr:hypothetical protein [Haloplasmataceae bacterium]
METFGRGCLYSIILIIILLFISVLVGQTINIPIYIFIPVVIVLFIYAKKVTENKGKDNKNMSNIVEEPNNQDNKF